MAFGKFTADRGYRELENTLLVFLVPVEPFFSGSVWEFFYNSLADEYPPK